MDDVNETLYFQITTPLGIRIRTTLSYWQNIVNYKHPIIKNEEEKIKETLSHPEEIHRSKSDPDVYLYYKNYYPYLICVVARHLNGEGFIITAYRTNRIKIGETVWKA